MAQLTIVGCGWLGMSLAQHLQAQGWQVSGSSRNPETLAELSSLGIANSALSLDTQVECADPEALFNGETLLINVPPGRQSQDNSYADRIALLSELAYQHGVRQAVFVSATSVYPDDAACSLMDESAPLAQGPRGQAMWQAEQAVKARFERVIILRAAGLVGGERHPGRFLAGRQGLAGAQSPVNLVHRDDVIGAIQCVLERGCWGEVFNLSAPNHPTREAFYPAAARALGLAEPSFGDEATEGKRVDGGKLVRQLGFQYRYPDPFLMPPMGQD
ncbi:SDR family oxidoreductase [Ferrimonas marina]|uniref:Nucleoside-diphosphate-sugar epimerase n=1 Tax=Ferrimonas marina TaxID=299255 RepID=A0A1M5YW30_9GAMM|nr:SDR family oxidoreductase [Ferrimonas marina]SHI16068.1 Nucleoside-diphosphate-sugar epimerase [Ferrimonas marina]